MSNVKTEPEEYWTLPSDIFAALANDDKSVKSIILRLDLLRVTGRLEKLGPDYLKVLKMFDAIFDMREVLLRHPGLRATIARELGLELLTE